MTFIIYLLGAMIGILSLISGLFPIDLIPDSVHEQIRYFGSFLGRLDVWIPGVLPIFFQKIDWIIWIITTLITYDLVNRFILNKIGKE